MLPYQFGSPLRLLKWSYQIWNLEFVPRQLRREIGLVTHELVVAGQI
jgi:hypothetical protein